MTRGKVKRDQLEAMFDREGVSPRSYSLTGPGRGEVYCLEQSNGGWAVYYAERGLRQGEEWFKVEDQACEKLKELVLEDPTTREAIWRGSVALRSPQGEARLTGLEAAEDELVRLLDRDLPIGVRQQAEQVLDAVRRERLHR